MKYTEKNLKQIRIIFSETLEKNCTKNLAQIFDEATIIHCMVIIDKLVIKTILIPQHLDADDVHFKVAVELDSIQSLVNMAINSKSPDEFYLIIINAFNEFEFFLNEMEYYEMSNNFSLFQKRFEIIFISHLNKLVGI